MDVLKPHIVAIQHRSADAELHWLISSIISPEFPQIIGALEICSNLILYNSSQHPDETGERGPAVKLPVSSTKLEALKGIITRDGAYITQLQVSLRERHFNRIIHRLHLVKPMLLSQIITAKKSIDNSIELIKTSQVILGDSHDAADRQHVALINLFQQLLNEIQTAKNSLQLPTNPTLVFPINVTPKDYFDPPLPASISIDVYISQAEICIDLKNLHHVHEEPWGEIDPKTGESYIDKIREEMKLPSSSAASIASSAASTMNQTPTPGERPREPLNVGDIELRLLQLTAKSRPPTEHSQSNLFNNMLHHLLLRTKYEPIDYITKCVTYNEEVVMINKKIEVSSPDPVLVSAFTKLDSIEYLISNFLESIHSIMESMETN